VRADNGPIDWVGSRVEKLFGPIASCSALRSCGGQPKKLELKTGADGISDLPKLCDESVEPGAASLIDRFMAARTKADVEAAAACCDKDFSAMTPRESFASLDAAKKGLFIKAPPSPSATTPFQRVAPAKGASTKAVTYRRELEVKIGPMKKKLEQSVRVLGSGKAVMISSVDVLARSER